MKTYYIYSLNCDCCSTNVAYYRHPRSPRCPGCNRRLGWMEFTHVDTVKIKNANSFDALKEHGKRMEEGKCLWQVKRDEKSKK